MEEEKILEAVARATKFLLANEFNSYHHSLSVRATRVILQVHVSTFGQYIPKGADGFGMFCRDEAIVLEFTFNYAG